MVLLLFAILSLGVFRPLWWTVTCGFFFLLAVAWAIYLQFQIRLVKSKLLQHQWQICTKCEYPLVRGERWLKCTECGKEFEKWEAPREWREMLTALRQTKFVKHAKSIEDNSHH